MYLEYWKIKEKPFENTPDPRFVYYSPRHEEALMRMLYAIDERKGCAMLTGDYGSGKTLLTRVLLQELAKKEKKYKVALIVNPRLTDLDLLREIIYQLEGVDHKGDKTALLHYLNDQLYESLNKSKEVVIIIDEAQTIKEKIFDELRLLLNFQLNDRFLLTMVMVGQPELVGIVKKIPQLDQRIAVRYHLTGLEEKETHDYIFSRYKIAGGDKMVFDDGACKIIYDSTKGIPRKINAVCDMSLVVGMIKKAPGIDKQTVQEVISDYNDQSKNAA